MKISTKIILPIILISALLILLAGCFSVPDDESPGYTPGTITGIIAAPCCSTSAGPVTEPCCVSPEYWCYYCQETWSLQDGVEVILTYGKDEIATTTTNEFGEYTFADVSPGKNYVITAYCPDYDDDRPLVKDVALELIEGGSFDTKITDLVSTSLGLVVDFLVYYTEWGPEDISLDAVTANKPNFYGFPKFKKLVIEVRQVLENCGNVDTDEDVQDALCWAAEEISGLDIGCGPGYTYIPPPPGPCSGNTAPSISSVLLDGTAVSIGETVHVVVGTPYVVTVNASDDGIADPLTFSATINGIPVGTVASNVITVTPLVAGTFEVYVNVNDGCTTTTWGPVTVVVDPITYTLTVNIVGSGSVTLTPPGGTYSSGTVVTLDPTAAAGWTFDGWSGTDVADLVDVGGGDWTIAMDEDKAVTATFTEDCYTLAVTIVGSGSVAKSPDETCYAYDTVVTLTPTPAAGWTFDGWSGTDVADLVDVGGGDWTIAMDEDKAVTATFTEDCYTLAVTIVGSGSVAKSPDETCYAYDTVVTLTPTPAAGWTFDGWSGTDVADLVDVGGGDWTIAMDEDKAVTATFTEDCYTLAVTIVGSGSVAKSPDETCYAYDTVVTLTPTPAAGWTFDGWSGTDVADLVDVGGGDWTIAMDEDKAVTATFTEDCYTLAVTIVGSGSVAKSPDETCYAYDTVVTLTPTPAAGWTFDGWSGTDVADLVDVGGGDWTIAMDEDKAVTATFTEDCYTLAVTIVGSGSVAKSPDETCYAYDTVVTLTPTPAAGWTFDGWSGTDVADLVDVGGGDWTIAMDEDKAVTATFTEAIISPEDSSMTRDPGLNRIRLTLIDQNGYRIPGDTLDLSLAMWEVFQGAVERSITAINYGTEGANWDVEIFVNELTGAPKPTVKYYGYDINDPVIIN